MCYRPSVRLSVRCLHQSVRGVNGLSSCSVVEFHAHVTVQRWYEKSYNGTNSPWYEGYEESTDGTKNPWYETSTVRKVHLWYETSMVRIVYGTKSLVPVWMSVAKIQLATVFFAQFKLFFVLILTTHTF